MLDCMCRYSVSRHTYRTHYVCIPCRVSFKAVGSSRCPHCGGDMINAGKDLRVPRKGDKTGWRTLVALLEQGIGFHSCGCCGPGYRPRTPGELRRWRAQA
jgi:DNA-directed RNA polymerase subunit RPC12/RpoP